MTELFLALRFLRPKRSYVSVITVISLLGVIFGVMVLIVVLSVMEGFEKELRDKVIGFNSHVTVTNMGLLHESDKIQKILEENELVEAVSPFALGPVLVECKGKISTPYIKGVRPEESEKVVNMEKFLVSGSWLEGSGAVIVGNAWAQKNQAMVGDKVLIHSPRNLEQLMDRSEEGKKEFYLPTEYVITGIFYTGMFDYDFNFFIMNLNEVQRLYNLGDAVHGLAIRLKDPEKAEEAKRQLNQKLNWPTQAMTWMDQNARLFGAIAMEKRVMSFLLCFVIIVAAFGICSTLITITVQKSKEIGLMKAIGAQNHQITLIFTLYGFVIGVLGSFLGTVGGLTMVHYRNEFSDWLAKTFGLEVFPAEIYHFFEIPAIVSWPAICWIAGIGILLSTLAAMIPAVLAAMDEPVASLRNE